MKSNRVTDRARVARITNPNKRVRGGTYPLSKSVALTRIPKLIASGPRAGKPTTASDTWTVHATKPRPWAVRSENRRRNRVARQSRKINRGVKS
jgi:hypothetical protein